MIARTTIGQRTKLDLLPFKCDEAANERTREFLETVVKICTDYIERENDRSEKVVNFYQPEEVMKMFDFSIPDSPINLDQLIEDCRRTLALQVKTGKYSPPLSNLYALSLAAAAAVAADSSLSFGGAQHLARNDEIAPIE